MTDRVQIQYGDRVRHVDGREGIATHLVAGEDGWLIHVTLDEGGAEVAAPGYWQKIPHQKLSA
jgi:hypothetical protein